METPARRLSQRMAKSVTPGVHFDVDRNVNPTFGMGGGVRPAHRAAQARNIAANQDFCFVTSLRLKFINFQRHLPRRANQYIGQQVAREGTWTYLAPPVTPG